MTQTETFGGKRFNLVQVSCDFEEAKKGAGHGRCCGKDY